MRGTTWVRWAVLAGVIASSGLVAAVLEHANVSRATDRAAPFQSLFVASVAAFNAGDYSRAESMLRDLAGRAPRIPEVHVNHGYALLALNRPMEARPAFQRALLLRPRQANAYYGLGIAQDTLGNRAEALGAMRSYVHLAPSTQPHVRKARAAIWEWQSELQRQGTRSPRADGPR